MSVEMARKIGSGRRSAIIDVGLALQRPSRLAWVRRQFAPGLELLCESLIALVRDIDSGDRCYLLLFLGLLKEADERMKRAAAELVGVGDVRRHLAPGRQCLALLRCGRACPRGRRFATAAVGGDR